MEGSEDGFDNDGPDPAPALEVVIPLATRVHKKEIAPDLRGASSSRGKSLGVTKVRMPTVL